MSDDDKSKEIRVRNKTARSDDIFGKYASGQSRGVNPVSLTAAEDKPRRKRKVIRLDQIVRFSPIQPGQRIFSPSISEDLELADSIRETGLQDPITVKQLAMVGDQFTYELVSGHRRYGAIKYNAGDQWSSAKVEAEILNSDEDEILVALHENRGVKPLSPAQRGELYQKLKEENNLNYSQIRNRYHLDESDDYIQRLMMAWNSPDPVRNLFNRGFPVNRTLDLRGAWNKLPENWKDSHSESFGRLSIAGANLFVERIRSGSSPDDAFSDAQAISQTDEIPLADSSQSQSGQGAPVPVRPSSKSGAPKGKGSSKEDQVVLEPMFYSLGLTGGKVTELKRAGGSDSFDEKILAALAMRRGLDTQQSLTGARALTHSRPLRHIAHRLVQDISKVLTKSADVPEYAFLKYILNFSDTRPSPQPVDRKAAGKRGKSDASPKSKKKRGK